MRTMRRRACSFAAAVCVFFGSIFIFPFAITAKAESEGYWKLVDSGDVIQKTDEEMESGWGKAECTLSGGHFTYHYECTAEDSKQYGAPPEHPVCKGDYVNQSISVSKPNSTYKAGETATLHFSSEVSHSKHMPDAPTLFSVVVSQYSPEDERIGFRYPSTYWFLDTSEEHYGGGSYGYTVVPNGGYTYIDGKKEYNCNGFAGTSDTLTAEMPEGSKDGEAIWIKYNFFNGITFYKYEWVAPPEETELPAATAAPAGSGQQENQHTGHWQLYETEAEASETWTSGNNMNGWGEAVGDHCYENERIVEVGKVTYKWFCINDHYSASGLPFNFKGDSAQVDSYTSAPPDTIFGDDTVTMTGTIVGDYLKRYYERTDPDDIAEGGSMDICAIYSTGDYTWFTTSDGDDTIATSWEDPTISGDFSCTIRAGREGETLEIRPRTLQTQWYYRYQWVADDPPGENGETGNTGEKPGNTPAPGGEDGKRHFLVDKNAWRTPGEDGGISIPGIVLGLTGVGGTAAGAAVAAGAASAAASDEKRRKSPGYKMYLYKDFGDCLKKGAPIEGVFARIAEVTATGQETDRPDLTAQIRLFSGSPEVSVRPIGLRNGYMGAEVCVPNENAQASEGIVCASFTGQGGTFTQNVHFRLIGARPYIWFPEHSAPHVYPFLQALFGDGCTYEVPFTLVDFAKPVTRINAVVQQEDGRIAVCYEAVDPAQNLFQLLIRNCTGGDVTPVGDFPKEICVYITAENETEFAEQYFFVKLYPEGIFVKIEERLMEDGYYSFYTCKGTSVDYHAPQLTPTPIRPQVAYKDGSGKVIVTYKGITVPEELTALDAPSQTVGKRFRYRIVPYQDGLWQLEPGAAIPTDPADRFLYTLDLTADVGRGYRYDLPVRLLGETFPKDALERAEEMKKLRRILEIVGLTANGRAQDLMRSWNSIPTNKLYLVRHAAYIEGRDYYLQENRDWMELSDKMDKEIAVWSTVRWLDNMAFSFVIRAYFGPTYGDLAEAVATPLYDFVIDFLGQRAMDAVWMKEDGFGVRQPDSAWDTTLSLVLQMGENCTWAILTDGASAADLKYKAKQIGCMIAAAGALNFARLYYFDKDIGGDFYKALVKAVSGTTLNLLKGAMIYFLVGKVYSNSAKLKPVLENLLSKNPTIRRILADTCMKHGLEGVDNAVKTSDAAGRLAEGLTYAAADTLNRCTEDFILWLRSVDPHSTGKQNETIEIIWNENDRSTISLTAAFQAICDYLMEQLGLRELLDDHRIQSNAQALPKEQPYVPDEEVRETFGGYGIGGR